MGGEKKFKILSTKNLNEQRKIYYPETTYFIKKRLPKKNEQ